MTIPVSTSIAHGSPADAFDACELTYEQRYFRRKVLESKSGLRFLVDLPEAKNLSDGDLFALDSKQNIIVRAAPESLAEIRGANLPGLAWHIGNRHTPCQVDEDRLLIQRDHVLEDMLRGLGANIRHVTEPFQPLGGAYGHGRTHGHSHSHDPHTDPNAHIPHRHD